MIVLVDSNVLIDVSRGSPTETVARWNELAASSDPILYSAVTVAELWAGARPKEHNALTSLFAALVCVPADAEIGRLAGDYLRQYRRSHNVELGDALIAASAYQSRAVLWTGNRKHYPMPDLSFY